jgi:hypothetical protein
MKRWLAEGQGEECSPHFRSQSDLQPTPQMIATLPVPSKTHFSSKRWTLRLFPFGLGPSIFHHQQAHHLLAMRTSTFAIFLTLSLACLTFASAAAIIEKAENIRKDFDGPTDEQIQKLLATDLEPPYPIGDLKKEPKDVGWRYLTPEQSLDKSIPYPKIPTSKGKCKIKLRADLVSTVV